MMSKLCLKMLSTDICNSNSYPYWQAVCIMVTTRKTKLQKHPQIPVLEFNLTQGMTHVWVRMTQVMYQTDVCLTRIQGTMKPDHDPDSVSNCVIFTQNPGNMMDMTRYLGQIDPKLCPTGAESESTARFLSKFLSKLDPERGYVPWDPESGSILTGNF